MGWYKTGTVAIANGSPSVTGTGTAWVGNAQPGHGWIGPDKETYEILSVNSDVSITLAENYAGTTVASGGAYKIIPTQGLTQALTAAVQQLVADFTSVRDNAGAGQFTDGTVAAPGIRFTADLDCGFYRIGTNTIGWATAGALRMSIDATGKATFTAAVQAANFYFPNAGGALFNAALTDGVFIDGTAHTFKITTNSVDRCLVDADGNVGIGVAAPAAKLHVLGPEFRLQSDNAFLSGYDGAGTTRLGFVQFQASGRVVIGAGSATVAIADSAGNFIHTAPATPPTLATNGQMVFNAVSNTVARLSYRGSDGVTRVANITLA